MRSFGYILKKQINRSPLWKKVEASLVVEMANTTLVQLFGEESKKYAQAVYIKNKILAIACLSNIMAQEIKFREQKIMSKINQKIGSGAVERIRYLA